VLGRILFYFGRSIRETGLALERTGCRLQGRYLFAEELSRHRKIQPLYNIHPLIGHNTFIAPNATVIGSTSLGHNSAVWYGVVVRSDENNIRIGENVSIGDRVTIHAVREGVRQYGYETNIGDGVTVGAGCLIHGATLEDGCHIGVGCTILNGSVIGAGAKVAPGSLVLSGMRILAGQYWGGSPAEYIRDLTPEEVSDMKSNHDHTLTLAQMHNDHVATLNV